MGSECITIAASIEGNRGVCLDGGRPNSPFQRVSPTGRPGLLDRTKACRVRLTGVFAFWYYPRRMSPLAQRAWSLTPMNLTANSKPRLFVSVAPCVPFTRGAVGALCALLLAMAGWGCSLTESRSQAAAAAEARQLTDEAIKARERGELETAARYLHRSLDKNPDDFQARCQLAETQLLRGRVEQALDELETARELNPDSMAVHVRLGELELGRRRFRRALTHLDEALELDPANETVYWLRGKALEGLDRDSEALASYYRALEFNPRSNPALLAVSRLHLAAGRPRQSLAKLRTVLGSQASPDEHRQAQRLMATALFRLERWSPAETAFANLIQMGDASAEDYCRLAYSQFQAGKPAEAQLSVAEALMRDPDHKGARALEQRLAASSRKALARANQRATLSH